MIAWVLATMNSKQDTENQSKSTRRPVSHLDVLVNGEHIDALPENLYIPPEALEVFLESFQGPLDLLLYLIRKQNIDILNIPIADITKQYMQYVELMRKIRLDLAAEYLLMAAMLAQIKSRMLLPRQDANALDEEEDPRAVLILQLQRYEQYALAAKQIDEMPRLERDLHLTEPYFMQELTENILPQATINELALAFRRVILRAQQNQDFHVRPQMLSMREKMVHILDNLQKGQHLRFEELFTKSEGREGVVVSFIAILELMRDGLISIVQNEAFSPIHVKVAS